MLTFFRYVGLSVEQVTLLRTKHHVYLQDTGRISIAYVQERLLDTGVQLTYFLSSSGLNNFNVDYVARSISAVVKATVSN
jgi:aspartate aminotransferase